MTSSKNSQVGKDSLMLIFPVVALNMLCMQWMLGVTTFCDTNIVTSSLTACTEQINSDTCTYVCSYFW